MIKNSMKTLAVLTSFIVTQGVWASGNPEAVEVKPSKFHAPNADLTPVSQPENQTITQLQPGKEGLPLIAPVRKHIITYLDPMSTLAYGQVCKQFYLDVVQASKERTNAIQAAFSGDKVTDAVLSGSRFHPSTLVQLFRIISRQVPIRAINYMDEPVEVEALNPLVTRFVHLVAQSNEATRFLCRFTMGLDPVHDFREVNLMAYVLQQSGYGTQLMVRVLNVLDQDTFLSCNPLIDGGEKNLLLQGPYLMQLKILALTGDPKATRLIVDHRFESLSVPTDLGAEDFEFAAQEADKALLKLISKKPAMLTWIGYLDNELPVGRYPEALQNAEITEETSPVFEKLTKFVAYAQLTQLLEVGTLQNLFSVCHTYHCAMGDEDGALTYESDMSKICGEAFETTFPAANVCKSVYKTSKIINRDERVWNNYLMVRDGIEKQMNLLPLDNDVRRFLEVKLAELAICYQDETRYEAAKDGLDRTWGLFDEENRSVNMGYGTGTEEINDFDVLSFQAALAISQGRFEEVMPLLQTITHYRPALLLAMKKQVGNEKMPKQLICFLGQLVRKSFESLDEERNGAPIRPSTLAMYRAIFDQSFMDFYLKHVPQFRKKLEARLAKSKVELKSLNI